VVSIFYSAERFSEEINYIQLLSKISINHSRVKTARIYAENFSSVEVYQLAWPAKKRPKRTVLTYPRILRHCIPPGLSSPKIPAENGDLRRKTGFLKRVTKNSVEAINARRSTFITLNTDESPRGRSNSRETVVPI
jgi:hypothetical protein